MVLLCCIKKTCTAQAFTLVMSLNTKATCTMQLLNYATQLWLHIEFHGLNTHVIIPHYQATKTHLGCWWSHMCQENISKVGLIHDDCIAPISLLSKCFTQPHFSGKPNNRASDWAWLQFLLTNKVLYIHVSRCFETILLLLFCMKVCMLSACSFLP